jgi:hypothetical protein
MYYAEKNAHHISYTCIIGNGGWPGGCHAPYPHPQKGVSIGINKLLSARGLRTNCMGQMKQFRLRMDRRFGIRRTDSLIVN